MGKVVEGLKDHAKTQHEITKARHEVSKKSPKQAHQETFARHADAKKSQKEKQAAELERLKSRKK